jgi:hypothetical protein
VETVTKTASAAVGGLGGALSYYAGSLWGSSVPAQPEKPAVEEEEEIDEEKLKIKKLYQEVDPEVFKEVRKEMKDPQIIF